MKTCATCRHYSEFGFCCASAAGRPDRVLGTVYPTAREAAAEGGPCGSEARLWQARWLPRGAGVFAASVLMALLILGTFIAFAMAVGLL